MTNTPSEHNQPEYGAVPSESLAPTVSDELSQPTVVRPLGVAPRSDETSDEPPSTTDVAKDEAAKVKDTALDAGTSVAETAKDEAGNVAAETKRQAKSLFGSVTSEVQSQAGSQQQKIASQVHALSKELGGMASGSSESGPLTDLAHQASRKGGEIAHWLENHEPRDVLREVQTFARRRPVAFLALCGLAGVVAGRLTRGAVAANTSIDSPSGTNGARRAIDSGAPATAAPARSLANEAPTSYGAASGEREWPEDVPAFAAEPEWATTAGRPESAGTGEIDPRGRTGEVR